MADNTTKNYPTAGNGSNQADLPALVRGISYYRIAGNTFEEVFILKDCI
ncbi:MAG: hypothetical protein JW915_18815 [Chitinispirillaceae bacterium]|nr:hypothetical protein [Chitinispirillaceae bacterium]